ncbi:hypothetical protein BVIR_1866 [Blastochloris viridis]|uniref:Energy transducer TonB n=2 Tax=Blastochloris viridis TaxID=1079 RepID=A0A0P0IF42_BLAVI|nr:hypothetical protein BVIR_1866 [Blastochloris viridis]CUU42303.1 hypothetical protein BVIRIDIS_13110 [Blastochloris viridis]
MVNKRDSRDSRRRSVVFGAGAVVVLGLIGGSVLLLTGGEQEPPRRVQEFMVVTIPPPPPPPEVQPPPEAQMVEQPKVTEQEFKEDKVVEQPKDEVPNDDTKADEPPGPPALDADAKGPGDMAAKVGGRPMTGGGGGGSRWGRYASMVQGQLEAALRSNPKTRNAVMQVQVRVWADSSGRISRIVLASSSGNPEIDNAIRNEVLAGIVLREPPPPDMPMPMVTRITARRPA